MFTKDILAILQESAELENQVFNEDDEDPVDKYDDEVIYIEPDEDDDEDDEDDDIPEVEDEIIYTEESVAIALMENAIGAKRYVVELDNLVKYCRCNDKSLSEGVEALAEHYGLNTADMFVLIESKCKENDECKATKEACKSKDPDVRKKAKEKLTKAKKGMKDLKKSGIKLLRKKDK